MKKKRMFNRRPAGPRRRRKPERREWIGGRLHPPFRVADERELRTEMFVWMELPSGSIVHYQIHDPEADPVSLGDALQRAMDAPQEGPPRKPSRIRVADASSAAEVRAVLPGAEIVVAPTPELSELLEFMIERAAEEAGFMSYLQGGEIPVEAVEHLFRSASALHSLAPWTGALEPQVARVDIPGLEIEGGCLSIIGAGGQSRGILLFPSLDAFQRFVTASLAAQDSGEPPDIQTRVLSLNFEPADDLPPDMLAEAIEHGWPVPASDSFPMVERREADGMPQPFTEHDIRVMAACASALASFCGRHPGIFDSFEIDEPVCESFFDETDLEVRLTVPYTSMELFDLEEGTSIDLEEEDGPGPEERPEDEENEGDGDVDAEPERQRLRRLVAYARGRFGNAWFERSGPDFEDPELALPLRYPWALHHAPIEGKPVSRWFLEDPEEEIPGPERAWLLAQGAAWLSIWEARAADPGVSLTLFDLLTGEGRTVRESLASRSIRPGTGLLCRVVEEPDGPRIDGLHPMPLPAEAAEEVAGKIRRKTRRKRRVPVETLRRPEIGRALIAFWEEAVAGLQEPRAVPPRMQNTDGEKLCLTADAFAFDPRHRKEILARLDALPETDAKTEKDGVRVYSFLRPRDRTHEDRESTVIGRATLHDRELLLETNSTARANALRGRVESVLRHRIRHRSRREEDPFSALEAGGPLAGDPSSPDEIAPEERDRVQRELKARHYAAWPDQPLPALDGKTPREAVRSPDGREQVDLLLRSCERHEARLPAGQRYDFSRLREELDLPG
ncbi:MAG: hypothetical protein GF346_06315 [Candidatus Eisenbacteria bacterium]|nr:hypothetical protein [Candidatus Latescibacterota bacterium]MBD3302040.1 hypothetical protein [Candidatus Eisenbacteria bacterium]